MNDEVREQLAQHLELMCCPGCGADLELRGEALVCGGCDQRFEIEGNLPLLFLPNEWSDSREDVTESMKAFPSPDLPSQTASRSLTEVSARRRFL